MATHRQKLVAQKLVENGGNLKKAMVDAGYSRNTAHTPQKLTKSKGWKQLSNKLFADEEVIKKHRELLDAFCVRKFVFSASVPDEDIKEFIEGLPEHKVVRIEHNRHYKKVYYMKPDNPVIGRALDMIYRVKGRYKQAKVEYNTPFENISDDELLEILREQDKHNSVCSYCLQPKSKQA